MIYNALLGIDVITSNEIKALFTGFKTHQINKICSNLSAKGYLFRLKKEVYMVQEKPSQPVIKNPYQIALILFKGYIGFSSALRVYDLLDYEPFTIFVVTKNKSREKAIGNYIFRSVAMGKRAVGITFHNGIYISTTAKTFFDCIYKPQYSGGYSTVTKALYDARFDWDEFIEYFRLASDSLCQRTGYILDILEKTDKKVPNKVLSYFEKRVMTNSKLLPSGKARGKYIRKWMLLDNLGEDNILSWWYHG